MGKGRDDIMAICPEDFADDLKDFIDGLEGEVSVIKDHMAISSITDIGRIDEAHDMIIALAESLY